ncbi:MAG: hypothetical protein HYU54_01375, partial [Actinobacteria bacterium]|nr:hypothetical protein [Actinomycetota bacterium]
AVISGDSDTATAKLDAMERFGLYAVRNPADIGATVLRALEEAGVPAPSAEPGPVPEAVAGPGE